MRERRTVWLMTVRLVAPKLAIGAATGRQTSRRPPSYGGRYLGHNGPEASAASLDVTILAPMMSRNAIAIAALLAVTAVAGAQEREVPLRIAASSFATTEVHLNSRRIGNRWYEEDASLTGPSRIAITYGQPHARGRRVEGGLIPLDTVWRFGANAATQLHTDLDIMLGDVRLEAGDYSLFVLYSRAGWQLIVNRRTGIWGSDYDRSRDVGRIPLTSRTLVEPEESLTVYLVPESAQPRQGYAELRGALRIKWGRTELTTNWRVLQP